MPVSIADVARRAGVSAGTVSHVLNNNARAGIAPATQERVRLAARELGYRPNRLARGLGRGRTDTVALFISGLQNPFFVQVMESAERLALEAGYHVLVDAAPPDLEASAPHHRAGLRGWPLDGALMWAFPGQTLHQHLDGQADGLPVVYLGGQPRDDGSDTVYFDVYAGTRALMAHLIAGCGYRRIAYLFPFPWVLHVSDDPRHKGYRDACEEAAIAPQMILMDRREQTRRAGREAGAALAALPPAERPEAVLCFNDVVAQGVLFGLRRAGLRVPGDIAVSGFDGIEEAQYLDAPLTTVRLPAESLCRHALGVLLRRISEGPDLPPQVVKVPTELVIGETA